MSSAGTSKYWFHAKRYGWAGDLPLHGKVGSFSSATSRWSLPEFPSSKCPGGTSSTWRTWLSSRQRSSPSVGSPANLPAGVGAGVMPDPSFRPTCYSELGPFRLLVNSKVRRIRRSEQPLKSFARRNAVAGAYRRRTSCCSGPELAVLTPAAERDR
jgi:hypothetical protein